MPYDPAFFSERDRFTRRSAEIVVPLILDLYPADTMIDVGCGVGTWASVFESHGVKAWGVDGDEVRQDLLQIRNFQRHDLEDPASLGWKLQRRFDLALSLEVAEHLSPGAAEGFIASLVSLAPTVVFSAAIPGQGGAHHVHERFLSYWKGLFEDHRYQMQDVIRPLIWDMSEIPFWYRQNIVVFVRDGDPVFRYVDIVHPELYVRGSML